MARWLLAVCLLGMTACTLREECCTEPLYEIALLPRELQALPGPFPPIEPSELVMDWGKELKVARSLAREMDLFRAITSYKRALILIPEVELDRKYEAQYGMVLCYYIGGKYAEAIHAFEKSDLDQAPPEFAAFEDLLIILEDSYRRLGEPNRADQILHLLRKGDPETAADLELAHLLNCGDLPAASCIAREMWEADLCDFSDSFEQCKLNPSRAQFFQSVLPGAGYWYIGQKKSALTSFLINVAFIAASWHFFDEGNWGAGIVTTSLEMGWYFGGVYGVGLAAQDYNRNWYSCRMPAFARDRGLAPALMLEFSF